MFKKRFRSKVALSLMVGVPLATVGIAQVASGASFRLHDRQGNLVYDALDLSDTITMKANDGSDVVYAAGPAYSPKATCGQCHDYNAITKAYHFMQGGLPGPDGMGVSDLWSSENQDGTTYKYLSNAYGHLLSGGQFGAW